VQESIIREHRHRVASKAMGEDADCKACAESHNVALEREPRDIALCISGIGSVWRNWLELGDSSTCLHAAPETRMTAIAAFPEAVERAYIVGSSWQNAVG
jgi:hypothetical protein